MFKSIRAIDRTNSEVIWTRICEDMDHLSKRPANPPPKKKFPVKTMVIMINIPQETTFEYISP